MGITAERIGYDCGYEYAGENPHATEPHDDPAPDEFVEAARRCGFSEAGTDRDDFTRGFRAGWRDYMRAEFNE